MPPAPPPKEKKEQRAAVACVRITSEGGAAAGEGYCDPRSASVRMGDGSKLSLDQVFAPEDPNGRVYELVVSHLVRDVLNGINAVVVVYGRSGTGKTYSMLGTPENHGMVPRAIDDVYGELARQAQHTDPSSERSVVRVTHIQLEEDGEPRDLVDYTNLDGKFAYDPETRTVQTTGFATMEAEREAAMELVDVGLDNMLTNPRASTVFKITLERHRIEQGGARTRISTASLHLCDVGDSGLPTPRPACQGAAPSADAGSPKGAQRGVRALHDLVASAWRAPPKDRPPAELGGIASYLWAAYTGKNCALCTILCTAGNGIPESDFAFLRGAKQVCNALQPGERLVQGRSKAFDPKREPSEPLPAGWERRLSEDGRPYYTHEDDQYTTWNDPRIAKRRPRPPPVDEALDALGMSPPLAAAARQGIFLPPEQTDYKQLPRDPSIEPPVALKVHPSPATAPLRRPHQLALNPHRPIPQAPSLRDGRDSPPRFRYGGAAEDADDAALAPHLAAFAEVMQAVGRRHNRAATAAAGAAAAAERDQQIRQLRADLTRLDGEIAANEKAVAQAEEARQKDEEQRGLILRTADVVRRSVDDVRRSAESQRRSSVPQRQAASVDRSAALQLHSLLRRKQYWAQARAAPPARDDASAAELLVEAAQAAEQLCQVVASSDREIGELRQQLERGEAQQREAVSNRETVYQQRAQNFMDWFCSKQQQFLGSLGPLPQTAERVRVPGLTSGVLSPPVAAARLAESAAGRPAAVREPLSRANTGPSFQRGAGDPALRRKR